MQVEILSNNKKEIELSVDNLTIAEVLRTYLNKQGIEFAAWRREHPTKPILFRIKSSNKTIKKEISEAIASIKKDTSKILSSIKKK